MGHWGFVFLAYGIVWSAIVLYLVILRRRLGRVEREANLFHDRGDLNDHG
ncbi:MAG: CcmD family protein [Deltaproteobacteria bacterium]|nr:CcmD family protein [Deltaproteobacteria bacterium]